jgi:predicted nucleic acid-binding protein
VIEEPESADLEGHVGDDAVLATSRLAILEVPRAARIANASDELQQEVRRLLAACLLVDVSDGVLRSAADLASRTVRTLDAVHLATALYIDADELVAYDRRLLDAAAAQGLRVAAPGSSSSGG